MQATLNVAMTNNTNLPAGTPPPVKLGVVLLQDGVQKAIYWPVYNGEAVLPVAVDVPNGTYLMEATGYAADNTQVGATFQQNVTIQGSTQPVPSGVTVG